MRSRPLTMTVRRTCSSLRWAVRVRLMLWSNGVILSYQFACNEPIGATVFGYRVNGWSHDRETLAAIIAGHIRTASQVVENAILAAAP